ncbi:DUF2695 domain-containing protein [Bacillus sp. V59.32b]|uniref:DUF2695 domain-containing protein n=1 Tax=Bacillus sp. V59.32b TaxID=1758642 RepID=UPI00265CB0FD|nr:DUF2695 domain-containing protein [Bacillus sp. V59.32b]
MGLSPEELDSLGNYIADKLNENSCDHTLTFTKEWLKEKKTKNKIAGITKALQNQGGFCDCEVLANVVE